MVKAPPGPLLKGEKGSVMEEMRLDGRISFCMAIKIYFYLRMSKKNCTFAAKLWKIATKYYIRY